VKEGVFQVIFHATADGLYWPCSCADIVLVIRVHERVIKLVFQFGTKEKCPHPR
jgi:hypothetical protein